MLASCVWVRDKDGAAVHSLWRPSCMAMEANPALVVKQEEVDQVQRMDSMDSDNGNEGHDMVYNATNGSNGHGEG